MQRFSITIVTSVLLLSVLGTVFPVPAFAKVATKKITTPPLERLFYYTDTDTGYASLKKHAAQIDIISPQAYVFDETGTLLGGVSDRATKVIKASSMRDMPLVENRWFDTDIIHTVLVTPSAQDTLIAALISQAQANGYYGYQLDVEHMLAADRTLFTAFTVKIGGALHAAGLKYSIAVVAKVSDDPADYSQKSWNEWAGAFDYVPLAQSADFLSIMLYDQDDSVGPASSLPWYTKVIAYATSLVPKEKLSVGLPFYAWEWKPGGQKKISAHTYQYVLNQIKDHMVVSTKFNSVLGTGLMSYKVKVSGHKESRILWYENVESFKLKTDILKKAGVLGFSGWAIGQEDARIWTLLPKKR
jgi:spore germination protein YaaH